MANTRRPKRTSTTEKPSPNNPLITAAEYFLSLRNFTDTQSYAIRANPTPPTSPPKLLYIASILSTRHISPTRPDYYSLLNLTPFETNITKIKTSFDNLTTILNPNTNKFPFSSEAFELVMKAWAVLSDPIEKAKFDQELKGNNNNDDNTFWTVCPYCYYVYEYERIYENCCVRCWNEKCGRGFSSVAIGTPPKEVIGEGKYKCHGFVPVGGNEWVPFVASGVRKNDCDGFIIDISDDENEAGEKKNKENGEKAKIGGEDESKFFVMELKWIGVSVWI